MPRPGLRLAAPEHAGAEDAPASAYIRPHELDVQHYTAGAGGARPDGMVAQLARAIIVGPVARLELVPTEAGKAEHNAGAEALIEAQMPAQQFRDMGFREGETLVVTPRRARVFVDSAT